MKLEILNQNIKEILIPLIITFIALLINEIAIYIAAFLIVFSLVFVYKNNLVISLIIILSISLRGEGDSSIREIFVLLSLLTLILLFIKKFGLNFNSYPGIPQSVSFFVLLFIFTIFFSASMSGYHMLSIMSIIRTIIFFIFCYLVYSLIDSEKKILNILSALVTSSLIISLTVYYDILEQGFTIFLASGYLARYTGINAGNQIALLFMITILIALGYLFIDKIKLGNKKYLFYIVILNNIFMLVIFNSRIAIACTIIGAVILLFILKRKLFYRFSFVLIVVVTAFFIIPVLNDLISDYFRYGDLSSREFIWLYGYEMVRDNLITGIGPSLYPDIVLKYYSSNYWMMLEEINITGIASPHNYLLLMAAENGILGIICFSYLIGLFLYLGLQTIQHFKNVNKDTYVLSITLTIIGFLVFFRSFFEVNGILYYGYLSEDLPFWILFIVLVYINRIALFKEK